MHHGRNLVEEFLELPWYHLSIDKDGEYFYAMRRITYRKESSARRNFVDRHRDFQYHPKHPKNVKHECRDWWIVVRYRFFRMVEVDFVYLQTRNSSMRDAVEVNDEPYLLTMFEEWIFWCRKTYENQRLTMDNHWGSWIHTWWHAYTEFSQEITRKWITID